MLGKIIPNLQDAIKTSIPTKQAQIPGLFGRKAAPKAVPKAAPKAAPKTAPKAAPNAAPKVDLMKGKWVKKGLGRRWQPDGLNRPMTPFEEHSFYVQRSMDSHKGKPKEKEPQYIKNTWQPSGDLIGFY